MRDTTTESARLIAKHAILDAIDSHITLLLRDPKRGFALFDDQVMLVSQRNRVAKFLFKDGAVEKSVLTDY